MTWENLQNILEVTKLAVEVLAFGGGFFILYKWVYQRRDRATEVLLQLDGQFNSEEIRRGRALVDDDHKYQEIRHQLLKETIPEDVFGASSQSKDSEADDSKEKDLRALEAFLRFYVLLCGIREAHQVPDSSLRKCFRFWLAHYYSPCRRELRLFVSRFYPTLTEWLEEDRRWVKRLKWFKWLAPSTFFFPEQFGWIPEKMPSGKDLKRAAQNRILVITGAGLSADSRIPTFRGVGGYWIDSNPKALATLDAFNKDPMKVWTWYDQRRKLIRKNVPNKGHEALRELAKHSKDFLLVTQNVDDFHQKAGMDGKQLVQIHGDIFLNKCTNTECDFSNRDNLSLDQLPDCPECREPLRPGVVWFDEELDPNEEDRVEKFLESGPCDLVIVIGTTATFGYIVNWALRALNGGGWLIEINPEKTLLSPAADKIIRRNAIDALPELVAETRST